MYGFPADDVRYPGGCLLHNVLSPTHIMAGETPLGREEAQGQRKADGEPSLPQPVQEPQCQPVWNHLALSILQPEHGGAFELPVVQGKALIDASEHSS